MTKFFHSVIITHTHEVKTNLFISILVAFLLFFSKRCLSAEYSYLHHKNKIILGNNF